MSMRRLFVATVATVGATAAFGSPPGHLNGCLYYLDAASYAWSPEQWREEVAAMRRAGLVHLIVSGPAQTALKESGDQARPAFERLLAACRNTDMHVYLALWMHGQWYGRWDLREELDTNRKVIDMLADRYAEHPNFGGWYIPHEIYVVWDDKARYIRDLYAGLSAMCKKRTPHGLVLVSPFFILDRQGYLGDFRFAEPAEYEAFWYDLLRSTRIDVVALQDSGEHLSCYTMDDRRPFMAAMKRACDRAGRSLWINIETGELDVSSLQDYETKFGRKTHVNDAKTRRDWRMVPPEKLRAKLQLAHKFAETTITWGYQEYWDPMRGPSFRAGYERMIETPQTQASRPR